MALCSFILIRLQCGRCRKMLLDYVVVLGGLCFLFIAYLRFYFEDWTERGVRGPKPSILSGTFPKTYAGKCNLIEELHEIYLQYKDSQKFVGIFTARTPKLFILDPKLATQILTQHFKNFRNNESSKWTTPKVEQMRLCSPFVSTDEAWKERRSELAPVLTANRLRSFYTTMQQCSEKLLDYIDGKLGQPLDAKELATRYTVEFIANFIWGIEAEAFSVERPSLVHQMSAGLISQALKCVRYYGRTAAWPWLRWYRPVPFFSPVSEKFFKQITLDAMAMREQRPLERGDVINQLLQLKLKKGLNDEQIAGHTTTVLIDGFETVGIVIAHCLLLLSRNEEVQQILRHELRQNGAELTYDQINELPYLDQCLQETLRIFPPLTTLFKLCTEPITLRNTDNSTLTLKIGDAVYISSYSFQRDGAFYERPDEFIPERFAAELGGVRKYQEMGVFLPFGDGPRICPGMKLALVVAKVAIAKIVRQYHLLCGPLTRCDNKISADSFLLTLKDGIELSFRKL